MNSKEALKEMYYKIEESCDTDDKLKELCTLYNIVNEALDVVEIIDKYISSHNTSSAQIGEFKWLSLYDLDTVDAKTDYNIVRSFFLKGGNRKVW